ncbi:proteobacterial dedicated sortase system histidine kinase [Thalassotalea sp. PLHSN55]|uniref:proteobacterial dedicated sortase system histidine kinase n=1 Tax=Thalassotalea sp. PLHSN55 TaxID=3435888 RepID=UPI003F85CECB
MKLGFKLRFNLRVKLLLLSSVLFTVPWFGYQYVWEMEKYLRFGQEQTLVGTARALATALHERPNLFNNQASFLPSVEQGKDLYGYQHHQAIQLDGLPQDWPEFEKRSHFYGVDNQIPVTTLQGEPSSLLTQEQLSLHYSASLGKYDKYLYLFFRVVDDHVTFRGKNSRSIFNNDHLELSLVDDNGKFHRYIISNKKPGWLSGYRITDIENNIPVVTPELQGQWLITPQGYNIELRLPLAKLGDKIAFAINDVDQKSKNIIASIGSADPSQASTLGTVLVPSPEIERIVKGMSYTHSSVWVVDQHHRVLASAGNIKEASGVWQKSAKGESSANLWQEIEQQWLHPLYYKILTKPPKDFIDQLYDASHLTGKHIESALTGNAKSQWRVTQDQQAVILSAAYPIYIDNKVKGAVIVEETTNGIRTVRNRALEKLFSAILAILLIGSVVFFIFASRISSRIVNLRNQAESAIDQQGRIKSTVTPSKVQDEIGDLSRSFSQVVNRLSQYNHYLENMSARLSHELRTPIAVVRTSLDNLTMQPLQPAATQYIERAQDGIKRLDHVLTRMSEATRLEQMLRTTDKQAFDLAKMLGGCILGYQQIYPDNKFEFICSLESATLVGSDEHVAQLLDKIITNAVEFSQDGKITIELKEDKDSWLVAIANKGELLPENMQDRLFDSMVSIRKESKSETPHLGLGLYIARLIAEFHHGKISAKNSPDLPGVVISFTLAKR